MPRLDKTGPFGLGPGAGWGMGYCGKGAAWGGGFGRGFGWRRFYAKGEESKILKEETKNLEEELKVIKKRLAEIGGQK